MGNELSMGRKPKSKKKQNIPSEDKTDANDNESMDKDVSTRCKNDGNSKMPQPMEMSASADTFARENPSARQSRRDDNIPVMITDGLSNVKERYHINPKEIGHGHYGVVRKCMDRKTKEWYAIKSIRKSKVNKIEVLKREITILQEVNHPNIIRLVEVHEDAKYLHLITELCTGGELFDRIIEKTQTPEGHFSEKDAASLIGCILDAITYCHDEKQIVHRDLKPENFLFASNADDAPVKIIDFGLSRHELCPGSLMKTKVGTPYYVAPEVLKRKYTKSCDIWSIGVISYILLCGYPPFYGDSDTQIFDSVRSGKFDFPSPEWDTISDAAKDFICCLLKKNPLQRLTASQAMQHKWILDFSSDGNSTPQRIIHSRRRSQVFNSYMGMQKLRKAALGYIATHLTPIEVGNLGDIFESIDSDKDGSMSLKDLDEALTSKNFSPDLLQRLRNLREDLSLTGEERLNWKDFLAAMMDEKLLIKEDKIRMAFDHFRKSEDKCLDVHELIIVLGVENATKEIMDLNNAPGDRITYEEFKHMMTESFTEQDLVA